METKTILEEMNKMAMNKNLNFLIGSGASVPSIPLMGSFDGDERTRNDNLLEKVRFISNCLLSNKCQLKITDCLDICKNLNDYEKFIASISDLLNTANARTSPRNATIFTTNYDLFIETAIDRTLANKSLVFNDGAVGYFNRYLDSSNYNKSVSYRGLNNNYTDELSSISLIKPHGSINWSKTSDGKIKIENRCVKNPVVVPPTGYESQETFLNNHFHEMLRLFQLELDKPQSVLFTIGFSFQDKHIGQMVKRALKNRELIMYVFCHSENEEETYLNHLGYSLPPSNLKIIKPSMLKKENLTLVDLTKVLKPNYNFEMGEKN